MFLIICTINLQILFTRRGFMFHILYTINLNIIFKKLCDCDLMINAELKGTNFA